MSLSNGARMEKAMLMVPLLSKSWGLALQFCREKHGFTRRQIAQNINVSEADIALWEKDQGVPTGIKLVRLHGMLPQLKNFKHLISQSAQKVAEMQEVAEQRKAKLRPPGPAPAPEPPPPAPPPTPAPPPEPQHKTFREALWSIRLKARLSATEIARSAGVHQTTIYNIEKGADSISPATYRALLKALPELREAPTPLIRAGRGESFDGSIILDEFSAIPSQPEAEKRISEPQPAASGTAALALNLTNSYSTLAAAQKRAAETMETAMRADEELKAAQAAVADAEGKLRAAMGLKQ